MYEQAAVCFTVSNEVGDANQLIEKSKTAELGARHQTWQGNLS
jgi:hypothetical protein